MTYGDVIQELRSKNDTYNYVYDEIIVEKINEAYEEHGKFKDLDELNDYLLTNLI